MLDTEKLEACCDIMLFVACDSMQVAFNSYSSKPYRFAQAPAVTRPVMFSLWQRH